jgi:hypothetical protein
LISKTGVYPQGGTRGQKLTAKRQAAVLDLSAATTTTLAGGRPLARGSSHLQEVTRGRPIIGLLQKTCASESMKAAMCGP